MPSATMSNAPDLPFFLKSLKGQTADTSIERLISLLKRRQIQRSKPCAIAVTHLLLRAVAEYKFDNPDQLLDRIRTIGVRLYRAQPQELVTGNIVRRVLGLVREVTEATPVPSAHTPTSSMILNAVAETPGTAALVHGGFFEPQDSVQVIMEDLSMKDVKDDVLNGIREMIEELDQADEQIAGYALEYISAQETILTYTSSTTIQKFLLSAAKKRKFTVIYVEGHPNEHGSTFEIIATGRKKSNLEDEANDSRFKPLTTAGVQVIIIPDSAVFAVMPRVTRVFLSSQSIMPNGGFVAASGSRVIAKAAQMHRVPVIAVGGIYKLSPLYPYNDEALAEYGDSGKVADYRDGPLVDGIDVLNPIHDYITPDLVDLVITNIGGNSPSYMHRIVADHYRKEDNDLENLSLSGFSTPRR